MPEPARRIENVVAEARLGGPWDLAALRDRVPNATMQPERFDGLMLDVPHGNALVAPTGVVVAAGARAIEDARAQMTYVRGRLRDAGAEPTSVQGFFVRNLVVSFDAGRRIPLDQVVLAFPEEDMAYEPAVFPGLVVRVADPRLTLLVFRSGRIVATATGDLDAVDAALSDFVGALDERRLWEVR